MNYELEIDDLQKFDIEKAIPCGLIMNEILSNAYKYAFPNMLSGEITISLKRLNDKCIMDVADNGVGMHKDFDASNSNSLGLELIHSLVGQLDGTIKITSESGTKFHLEFPYI